MLDFGFQILDSVIDCSLNLKLENNFTLILAVTNRGFLRFLDFVNLNSSDIIVLENFGSGEQVLKIYNCFNFSVNIILIDLA